ncbi:MAG: hypothetical protein ACPGMR_05795 [Pontibacterium sp.]
MKYPALKTCTLALAIALVGCGTQVKPISDAEITAAQQNGTLASLYQDLSAQLKADPNNAGLLESRNKVGSALGQIKLQEVIASIQAAQNSEGYLPAPADANIQQQVAAIAAIDGIAYQQASNALVEAQNKRNTNINGLAQHFAQLSPIELIEREKAALDIFSLDADLNGKIARYNTLITQALSDTQQAVSNDNLSRASKTLKDLSQVQLTAEQLKDVNESYFSVQISQLEAYQQLGDVEALYALIAELAADYPAPEKQQALMPYSSELLQYFGLMAQSAQSEDSLLEAYQQLMRIQELRKHLPTDISAGTIDKIATTEFVSQVFTLAQDAYDTQEYGLAFAYFRIIDDFDEDAASATPTKAALYNKIFDSSVVKLAASEFDSPSNAPGLGALITASLIENFVNADHADIRILERDSMNSILKEQEIKALQEGGEINLSTADYLVQGAVVEANVDESERSIKKTKRVVTEIIETPNPEYAAWQAMTEQERSRSGATAPAETLEKEVKEMISFRETNIRKLGSVSTSFRMLDPIAAKLLHAETLSAEALHEGQSIEGVEIGLYTQEGSSADLPPSTAILRDLATQQANEIATKLVDMLKDPEVRYAANAERYIEAGNPKAALMELAKAIVMNEKKAQDTAEPLAQLKAIALDQKPY